MFFFVVVVKNVFRPNENENQTFSNSSGFKSTFEKFPFRDGLVWMIYFIVLVLLF